MREAIIQCFWGIKALLHALDALFWGLFWGTEALLYALNALFWWSVGVVDEGGQWGWSMKVVLDGGGLAVEIWRWRFGGGGFVVDVIIFGDF